MLIFKEKRRSYWLSFPLAQNTYPLRDLRLALSAGAVEYTDCFSTEAWDSPQWESWWPIRLELLNTPTASLQRRKTPPTSVLDITKQSNVEVPVMLELGGM